MDRNDSIESVDVDEPIYEEDFEPIEDNDISEVPQQQEDLFENNDLPNFQENQEYQIANDEKSSVSTGVEIEGLKSLIKETREKFISKLGMALFEYVITTKSYTNNNYELCTYIFVGMSIDYAVNTWLHKKIKTVAIEWLYII